MRRIACALSIATTACGTGALQPDAPIAPLAAVGPARQASEVRVHAEPVGMFTLIGSDGWFRLALTVDEPRAVGQPARDVGTVRTDVEAITRDELEALACGWRFLGTGQTTKDCDGRDRTADREAMRPRVEAAIDALRARVAAVGATSIERAACFCARSTPRFWCQGTATVDAPGAMNADVPTHGPEASSPLAPASWVIGASAEGGLAGAQAALGAKLIVRQRPFELVLEPLFAPAPSEIAVGLAPDVRAELGRSGLSLLAAFAVAGATRTNERGGLDALLLTPSAGLSWQLHATTPAVEPFLELTGGWVFVPSGSSAMDGPSVMLGAGLVWPEAR